MNIDLSINGCSHSKKQFDDKKEDFPEQKFELRQERLQDAIQTKPSFLLLTQEIIRKLYS